MAQVPVSRTHVVDLSCMPREQVIDVAKRQAMQIREKNIRIAAMEELIENLTGNRASDVMSRRDTSSARGSSDNDVGGGPVGSSPNTMRPSSTLRSSGGGGGDYSGVGSSTVSNQGLLAGLASSIADLIPRRPIPEADNARVCVSSLEEAMEEERLQFVSRISSLEADVKEREDALAAKSRALSALEEQVKRWKEKVKATLRADQERIDALTAQLQALRHERPNVHPTPVGASNDPWLMDNSTTSSSPSSAMATAAVAACHQPSAPSAYTACVVETEEGVTDRNQHHHEDDQKRLLGPRLQRNLLAEENTTLRLRLEQMPKPAHDPSAEGFPSLSPFYATASPLPATAAANPTDDAAAEAAGQPGLAVWRERFSLTLAGQQARVNSLDAQLAEARAATSPEMASEVAAAPASAVPWLPPFGKAATAVDTSDVLGGSITTTTAATTPAAAFAPVIAASAAVENRARIPNRELDGQQKQKNAPPCELHRVPESHETPSQRDRSLQEEFRSQNEKLVEAQAARDAAAEQATQLRAELETARGEAATAAATAAAADRPCEQCEALQKRLAEWRARSKDVIADAQTARTTLEAELERAQPPFAAPRDNGTPACRKLHALEEGGAQAQNCGSLHCGEEGNKLKEGLESVWARVCELQTLLMVLRRENAELRVRNSQLRRVKDAVFEEIGFTRAGSVNNMAGNGLAGNE